jgi:hypothetical protein
MSATAWLSAMNSALEILGQILLFLLAIWFIRNAYIENRKAPPLTFRKFLFHHNFSEGLDSMFLAGGFVLGGGLILLLLLKNRIMRCCLFVIVRLPLLKLVEVQRRAD